MHYNVEHILNAGVNMIEHWCYTWTPVFIPMNITIHVMNIGINAEHWHSHV